MGGGLLLGRRVGDSGAEGSGCGEPGSGESGSWAWVWGLGGEVIGDAILDEVFRGDAVEVGEAGGCLTDPVDRLCLGEA